MLTFTNWELLEEHFEISTQLAEGSNFRPTLDNLGPEIKIRKDFAESFCWTDVDPKNTATAIPDYPNVCRGTVTCDIPSSLAKYFVYSVSMNPKYGIGVTEVPSEVTTKLPFYMVWNPPYSVKRDEILIMDIAFFNSITEDQDIIITINNEAKRIVGEDFVSYGWIGVFK